MLMTSLRASAPVSRCLALALCSLLGVSVAGCERAAEKIGRVGETASRQVGRSVTDAETQGDDAIDEPFQRVQEAADERLSNAGDSIGSATSGVINEGMEQAEGAARGAAERAHFSTADASDEFDSVWAEKPRGPE